MKHVSAWFCCCSQRICWRQLPVLSTGTNLFPFFHPPFTLPQVSARCRLWFSFIGVNEIQWIFPAVNRWHTKTKFQAGTLQPCSFDKCKQVSSFVSFFDLSVFVSVLVCPLFFLYLLNLHYISENANSALPDPHLLLCVILPFWIVGNAWEAFDNWSVSFDLFFLPHVNTHRLHIVINNAECSSVSLNPLSQYGAGIGCGQ